MKFFLISDNVDTQVGMRLSGIEGIVVHTRPEVEIALKNAIEDAEIGIILITERLVAEATDAVYTHKLKNKQPLIIEIPDRHGSGRSKDSITRYIREAIGVKI